MVVAVDTDSTESLAYGVVVPIPTLLVVVARVMCPPSVAVNDQLTSLPPAPVASTPSQRPAPPVIATQFGVKTPAMLSRPVPVKSVKFSLFKFKAPAVIFIPPEVESPVVVIPTKLEVEVRVRKCPN